MTRCVPALALLATLCAGDVAFGQPVSARAFRLFLVDGTEVATHGEASRVDDLVVAVVPVGPETAAGAEAARLPTLQTITLRADRVDWPRTEAYLEAVRRAQYAEASGARDYAAFTADIAAALDQVSSIPDPLARIAVVEAARARLAAWPSDHFGYRQQEATALLSMLDDVLLGLRAAAGQQRFSFALAAGAPAPVPPPPDLRRPPTLQEMVAQALVLSRHVADATERETLLSRALAIANGGDAAASWDRRWRRDVRRDLGRRLDAEHRATRAYASLRARAIARLERLAAKADVRGLLALRDDLARRDARLGRQRPAEMAGLLAHLDQQLASARRLRLALDHWEGRRPIVEAFAEAMTGLLRTAAPVLDALDDVRTLAGPPLEELDRAAAIVKGLEVSLAQVRAPAEGEALRGLVASGLQMASQALARRRTATTAGSLPQAWEASAAAAGALLVFERLGTDLPELSKPPTADATAAGARR